MFSQTINLLQDYYKFRKTSKPKGGHGIHSPFVYDLYTQAIDYNKNELVFDKIEKLRKELIRNKTPLTKSAFGIGSSVQKSKTSIGEIASKASIPPYKGRLIHRLVKYFNPVTVIELGTSLGISTSYLALGNQKSNIYTIEGDSNLSKLASNNLNKLGVNNVTIITGDFDKELPILLDRFNNFDLALIDGNHSEEATMRYFYFLTNKANSNSFIFFDDINWSYGMKRAWNNICNDENVSISIDLFNCGLIFFRKGIVKQHFNLRYGPF